MGTRLSYSGCLNMALLEAKDRNSYTRQLFRRPAKVRGRRAAAARNGASRSGSQNISPADSVHDRPPAKYSDRKTWGDQITITKEVVSRMAEEFDDKVTTLFLDRRGDQVAIAEEGVKAKPRREYWGVKDAMALLLERRGDHIITEEVVEAVTICGQDKVLNLAQRSVRLSVQGSDFKTAILAGDDSYNLDYLVPIPVPHPNLSIYVSQVHIGQ